LIRPVAISVYRFSRAKDLPGTRQTKEAHSNYPPSSKTSSSFAAKTNYHDEFIQ
jgi:hypothetical protein